MCVHIYIYIYIYTFNTINKNDNTNNKAGWSDEHVFRRATDGVSTNRVTAYIFVDREFLGYSH